MKQVPRKVKIFSTSVYTIWKQGEYTIPIHSYHIAWGNQCRSTVTHHRCVPRQYCLPFAAVNNFEGMVGRGRCRGCMCPVVLCVLGVSFHHPSIRQRQGGYNMVESSSNNVQQTVSIRKKPPVQSDSMHFHWNNSTHWSERLNNEEHSRSSRGQATTSTRFMATDPFRTTGAFDNVVVRPTTLPVFNAIFAHGQHKAFRT